MADARNWYAAQSLEHGWSRNVLAMQIDTHAYSRAGAAITNFDTRLPPPQSDLAREALKDPYVFDFLGLTEDAQERHIETALTRHTTRFLLELGAGFAFVGRQYRLVVGGDEFFIDLLFYHLKLRSYAPRLLRGGEIACAPSPDNFSNSCMNVLPLWQRKNHLLSTTISQ